MAACCCPRVAGFACFRPADGSTCRAHRHTGGFGMHWRISGLVLSSVLVFTSRLWADATADSFATDPIANQRASVVGDASRFTYNAAAQTITANYNAALPTAKLVFPLASAINQNRSFTFSTT